MKLLNDYNEASNNVALFLISNATTFSICWLDNDGGLMPADKSTSDEIMEFIVDDSWESIIYDDLNSALVMIPEA